MAAKVIPISLQEDVSDFGHEIAKNMFGNNFSAFVTFLICNYRAQNNIVTIKNDIKKESTNQFGSFLDNIEEHFLKSL